ncbi:MAG: LysR family transcriptional regulator [Bdellovibrionales bacterium]
MNFNLLKSFIKVAEFGSFTKAAKQLKQPKSRVSRSIGRLEEDLGTELIRRNTRSISLTEAGTKLYQETQGLINQLEKKVELISIDSQGISGTLSVSAPLDFGDNVMPAILCDFAKVHPHINFKILLSDSYVDLTANDIDVALRVGNLKDSSFKQKKLTDTQLILVASSEYLSLKGLPKKWEDFKDHNLLSFYNENHQDPLEQFYQLYSISPNICVNSFPMLKKMAIASEGIVILPNTMCKKQMTENTLVRVLPKWGHTKSPLQAVYSSNKNLHPKTRAFIDFLSENKKKYF